MTEENRLNKSYSYSNTIVDDFQDFKNKIESKKIIPYQVEFQPPPSSLKKICWLECSYCYGGSADDSQSPRMEKDVALRVLKEVADGGVQKVIFAGYATDPLNSPYIDDLLEKSIDLNLVFGFNTKALKISEKFLGQLKRNEIRKDSYISLSVDAGSNQTYNFMHDVTSIAKIYDKVLQNTIKIREANKDIDISAAYLVNKKNDKVDDVKRFIEDFRNAGCNYLRFSFLQKPKDLKLSDEVLPNYDEQMKIKEELMGIILKEDSEKCKVKLLDIDKQEGIYRKNRTVPCFARFIFPTVGYDGWLYNCSQSSSPNFHPIAVGNLAENNFWDLFYNYDISNPKLFFENCSNKLKASGCKCDRKMHLANKAIINSKVFDT